MSSVRCYVLVNGASRHDPLESVTLRLCVSLVSLIAPCQTHPHRERHILRAVTASVESSSACTSNSAAAADVNRCPFIVGATISRAVAAAERQAVGRLRITVSCYILKAERSRQTASDSSFIGGRPKLPQSVALPTCKFCAAQQTFFFQVAFPADHVWAAKSLAVFNCTSCYDEDHLIPDLLPELKNAKIPGSFLTGYQKNFRFLVFPTESAILRDYNPRIAFQRFLFQKSKNPRVRATKVGGEPRWVMENEAPSVYDRKYPLAFVMQFRAVEWNDEEPFVLVRGAPGQVEENFETGAIGPSRNRYYELFVGSELYFFGTIGTRQDLVYCIPQKP